MCKLINRIIVLKKLTILVIPFPSFSLTMWDLGLNLRT